MINVFLLAIHIIFIVFIFYKIKKKENLTSALLNLLLIIIIFTVGWSLISLILKIFISPQGLGKEFNRDTITFTLLTTVEFFFYKFYYSPYFHTEIQE